MERKCENCKESINHKRSTARFCSSACRAEFWRYGTTDESNKKKLPKEETKRDQLIPKSKSFGTTHIQGLKGVLEDKVNESNITSTPTKQIHPAYGKLKTFLENLGIQINTQIHQLKQLHTQRTSLENGYEGLFPVAGSLGGLFIDLPKTEEDENGKAVESSWARLGAFALGLGGGFLAKKVAKQNRLNSIKEVKAQIVRLTKSIQDLKAKFSLNKLYLSKTKKYIEIPKVEQNNSDQLPSSEKSFDNVEVQSNSSIITDDKIICSNDLKKMEFKSLNFQDKWQELFGNPAVSFHLVVHGRPGQGKSTFCLQFAHYLATNFGKVLYVSGEEGFSKTMKDKFENNNAFSKNLYLADIHSSEDLVETIKADTFHFIFIDSLNNMGIDINSMKEIRDLYGNSALITISQSTKQGHLRGSLEIEHEADVSMKVEDGLAFATKNRFKELGFEFSIFENH